MIKSRNEFCLHSGLKPDPDLTLPHMHLNAFHAVLRQISKCRNCAILLLKLSLCAIFTIFPISALESLKPVISCDRCCRKVVEALAILTRKLQFPCREKSSDIVTMIISMKCHQNAILIHL